MDNNLDLKKVTLTDGKILLRPYRMNDVDTMYQAIRESIKEVGAWLPFAHEGYAIKESRDYLKKRAGEWKKGINYDFGIFDAKDGVYVGGCGINNISRLTLHANLGYWVRTSRMGQGVAPAATRLLAEWAFEALKLNRIEILVAVGNERSLRTALKAGAKREGILRNRLPVNGVVCDAVMHSLIPSDFKA
jgi:ribosomal-protein-serine acetyltransferase